MRLRITPHAAWVDSITRSRRPRTGTLRLATGGVSTIPDEWFAQVLRSKWPVPLCNCPRQSQHLAGLRPSHSRHESRIFIGTSSYWISTRKRTLQHTTFSTPAYGTRCGCDPREARGQQKKSKWFACARHLFYTFIYMFKTPLPLHHL